MCFNKISVETRLTGYNQFYIQKEFVVNDELNLYLRTVPNLLRHASSALGEHISASGNLEDVPTEAVYEEFLQATVDIINAGANMAKTLKIMAEEIHLPEPGPIAGAALKPRLGFDHVEKNEIVYKALVSARQILNSHFDTVQPLAAEVADILSETPE